MFVVFQNINSIFHILHLMFFLLKLFFILMRRLLYAKSPYEFWHLFVKNYNIMEYVNGMKVIHVRIIILANFILCPNP